MTPLQVIDVVSEARYQDREYAYIAGIQFGEWMRIFTPGDFDHELPEYPRRENDLKEDETPMPITDAAGMIMLDIFRGKPIG